MHKLLGNYAIYYIRSKYIELTLNLIILQPKGYNLLRATNPQAPGGGMASSRKGGLYHTFELDCRLVHSTTRQGSEGLPR